MRITTAKKNSFSETYGNPVSISHLNFFYTISIFDLIHRPHSLLIFFLRFRHLTIIIHVKILINEKTAYLLDTLIRTDFTSGILFRNLSDEAFSGIIV